MQDPDIHLRPIIGIDIGVTNPLKDIQPFLYFPKNGVLTCKRKDIGPGKRDKKLAVVEIGSRVGSDNKSNLIDFPLHIDLILKIRHIHPTLLPNSRRLWRPNLGHIIYIPQLLLFCISANMALL
jgi:hypothetical protein